MNRKGEGDILGLDLVTIIKLVLAIMFLVGIGWMTYKLVSIFAGGENDYRAQRNFDLLTSRIQYAADNNVGSSVILEEPQNKAIIGFDAGQDAITFASDSKWYLGYDLGGQKIAHPNTCSKDKACICAVSLNVKYDQQLAHTNAILTPDFIDCKNVPVAVVSGNIEKTEIERSGINIVVHPELVNGHSQLFLVTPDPINVGIEFAGKGLMIGDLRFQPRGGNFGGSGATGSY